MPAYLLDLLIRGALVALIGIPLTCAGFIVFGPAPIAIVAFVLEWFYGGIFEALWNGQTPGKRLLRIRRSSVWPATRKRRLLSPLRTSRTRASAALPGLARKMTLLVLSDLGV